MLVLTPTHCFVGVCARIAASAMVFSICNCSVSAADPLIDEVIAGSDLNVSKIRYGKAIYDWASASPTAAKDKSHAKIVVYFDGRKTRIDEPAERAIVDDERYVSFDTKYLGTRKELPPQDYSAFIMERRFAPPFRVHPYYQGLITSDTTIADELRSAISKSDYQVTARREGNLIHIVVESKSGRSNREYFVDPAQGYVPVRYLAWSPSIHDSPAIEITTELERIPSGAYIEKHRVMTTQIHNSREVVGVLRSEATLVEFSPERPDANVFTLEALSLPSGAYVQDRIKGGNYIFGVAPPDKRIELPPLCGPAVRRRWFIGVNIVVILALLGLWAFRQHRRSFAP